MFGHLYFVCTLPKSHSKFHPDIRRRQGSHSGHYRPSLERVHVPMGSRRACCQVIRPFANGIQVLIQVAWGSCWCQERKKTKDTVVFVDFFPNGDGFLRSPPCHCRLGPGPGWERMKSTCRYGVERRVLVRGKVGTKPADANFMCHGDPARWVSVDPWVMVNGCSWGMLMVNGAKQWVFMNRDGSLVVK